MSEIKLTQRDMEIFTLIGKRGCSNVEAISRNFFDSESTCAQRLNRLARCGNLHKFLVQVRKCDEIIYCLSKRARILFDEGIRSTFYAHMPSLNEMKHALEMGDILDSFGSKVVKFQNEHELKGEKGSIPDGFVVLSSGMSFFIECDGAYFGTQLENKAQGLARTEQNILWVCRSKERQEHIREVSSKYQNIYPVLFEDLKNL